ncbi:disulfide bond formation protein B [Candidatus Daviesbacteria bacterium]|nr:disulfide bond formation protein B [Candidatus Daviesbacteria bacterium]
MFVKIKDNLVYLAWVQALIATLGSLYFSEILGFVPCILCWYQRILTYPLVIIIAVGILLKDKKLAFYVLPFSLLGMVVAFYQYLLQMGVIADQLGPCSLGVSCTSVYIEWFGFITIPFLSLLSFAIITACMYVSLKERKK